MCTVLVYKCFNPHTTFVLQFDKFPGKMDGLYRHTVSTAYVGCNNIQITLVKDTTTMLMIPLGIHSNCKFFF